MNICADENETSGIKLRCICMEIKSIFSLKSRGEVFIELEIESDDWWKKGLGMKKNDDCAVKVGRGV